jgi:hypothetical protein
MTGLVPAGAQFTGLPTLGRLGLRGAVGLAVSAGVALLSLAIDEAVGSRRTRFVFRSERGFASEQLTLSAVGGMMGHHPDNDGEVTHGERK